MVRGMAVAPLPHLAFAVNVFVLQIDNPSASTVTGREFWAFLRYLVTGHMQPVKRAERTESKRPEAV